MKKVFKILSLMLVLVATSVTFQSCKSDDGDVPTDWGSDVAGVYVGKLMMGDEILEDAYVVTVTRIGDKSARVEAKFFGDDLGANFNIDYVNGIYMLQSSTVSNINISVRGKVLSVSYTNYYGNLVTFQGTK